MKPLKIQAETNELVVIKNLCTNTYDVAMNPWLSLKIEFISITKGKTHVFTVINTDGSTWNFSWGEGGATVISSSVELLKKKVLAFLDEECILLGCTGKPRTIKTWKTGSAGSNVAVRIDAIDGSYDCKFLPEEVAHDYMMRMMAKYDLTRGDLA